MLFFCLFIVLDLYLINMLAVNCKHNANVNNFAICKKIVNVCKLTIIRALDIHKGQLRTFKIDSILSAIDTKLIGSSEVIIGN